MLLTKHVLEKVVNHSANNIVARKRPDPLAQPPSSLQDYLPKTYEERLAKLKERMAQRWPTFHIHGEYDTNRLHLTDHEQGTVVRFYGGQPLTFHDLGAVKHGPFWCLSEVVDGKTKFNTKEMHVYLSANKLNWVVML